MAKSKSQKSVAGAPATNREMSDGAREMLALVLSGFALYALLSLLTFHIAELDQPIPIGGGRNLGGTFGYYLASGFTYVLGYAAALPFLGLLGCAVTLFLHRRIERALLKAIGVWMFTAMVALLLADPHGGVASGWSAMTPHGPGGAFGSNLSPRLYEVFGGPGRMLLLLFGAIVSLVVATDWMFSHALQRGVTLARAALLRIRSGRAALAGGVEVRIAEADADAATGAARRPLRQQKPVGQRQATQVDGDEDEDQPSERLTKAGGQKRNGAVSPLDEDFDDDDDVATDAIDDAADSRPTARPRGANQKGKDQPKSGTEVEAAGAAESEPAAVIVPQPVVVVPPKPVKPKAKIVKPKPKQADLPYDEAYPYPPVELFRESESNEGSVTQEHLDRNGTAIISKLQSFGISAEVVVASIGPAVTQYELRLAEGIRVKKVIDYADDLAAALKALSVRVVAPIPGKDTIGIEVPNPQRQKVLMRDLLDQFGRSDELAIPLYLGKDVSGTPIVEDLARMPHLLIAGTTGSGKSVCINAILLSILMTRTPAQVKLILVDPKQVELQAYKKVPHLCCDVVSNMRKAPSVLQWAVDEMENRYTLLSQAGVNHIKSYNRLGQQELEKRFHRQIEPDRVQLPYVVIVIDEFADLMNVAQAEVEESIQRLAQKSRAVGMHVILATQRPSSEVITGIIKANLPCQIAFKVNRKIDSRVILDTNGAEKLLGHGDMLYMPPGGGGLTRAQGAFVSDDEMQAVVRFLEEKGQKPTYLPELLQTETATRKSPADRDELYVKAVEVILENQRGSATLLQRKLGVGYTRGTRLLEMMEEDGLVGAFNGAKSREVLMTHEEYRAREAALQAELEAAETSDSDESNGADAVASLAADPSDREHAPESANADGS